MCEEKVGTEYHDITETIYCKDCEDKHGEYIKQCDEIQMVKDEEQVEEEMEGKEEYDDKGVLCRYTLKEGWQPIEEHCEKCGFTCEKCDCEEDEEEPEKPRQVLFVNYVATTYIKIPKGVDLEDETVVESWFVKWNKIGITYVDGRYEEIEAEYEPEMDMKYPSDQQIGNAADYGFDSDDE